MREILRIAREGESPAIRRWARLLIGWAVALLGGLMLGVGLFLIWVIVT